MKLVDLRKLSIRGQSKIHFRLRNGMECVVTENGVAQVPGLKGIPDFNLEEELASAGEFLLEPAAAPAGKKSAAAPRRISREELAAMATASAHAAPHDEEE